MRAASSPLLAFLAGSVLLALGCGGGDGDELEPPAFPPPTPGGAEAAGEEAGRPAPDPLRGRSIAEICADDSLALIRWDYDQLHSGFHDLCCGPGKLEGDVPGADLCSMDWPFNDVPSCSAYDHLRNGIYARYGYPFTKTAWQEEFSGRDWYQLREDFDSSWLSPTAAANVQRLKDLKADGVGCMD